LSSSNDAHSETKTINDLSSKDAERIVAAGTVSVIDLRSEGLFEQSHPPGAISMPAVRFYSMVEQIQKEIPSESGILLYGKGVDENRISDIAKVLQMMGYRKIYILDEDWSYGS
jgi:rhodanese-related sulfurtransferase